MSEEKQFKSIDDCETFEVYKQVVVEASEYKIDSLKGEIKKLKDKDPEHLEEMRKQFLNQFEALFLPNAEKAHQELLDGVHDTPLKKEFRRYKRKKAKKDAKSEGNLETDAPE